MVGEKLSDAIACWEEALGKAKVITGESVLNKHLSNILHFKLRAVPAILIPRRTEDIINIIGIANEYRAPLYPVSAGKNWGLGSMLPVKDRCTIVLLNQKTAIIEVNKALRYAIVERGVTQKQLADYLDTGDRSLTFAFTGAGPDTSILGNILERGTGFLGQRTQNLLALEIVLGNQQTVRTGLGRFYDSLTEAKPFTHMVLGPISSNYSRKPTTVLSHRRQRSGGDHL